MKEFKIKQQMVGLTYAERKAFLKGLIKNAKETKRANSFTAVVKNKSFPMALLGGVTTFIGVTAFGLSAWATGAAPEVAALADELRGVGVFALASGALALFRADSKWQDSSDRAKYAKALADSAKQDIDMLKRMYKEVEAAEGRS